MSEEITEETKQEIDKQPYEILKEYMVKKKLKQKDIAELLMVNQATVSTILKGKRKIKQIEAEKLAGHFGENIEAFYKLKNITNGQMTTSISIGTKESVAENCQEKPILIKEKLKPKATNERCSEVAISFGLTKALGNFEFMRVDVYAKDFCATDQKQQTWDLLEKEVSERLEKVLNSVEKYRSTPVGMMTANPVNDLPPLEEETVDKLFEFKKSIHAEMLRLAKASKLKFTNAVNKLKEVQWSEEFAQDLLNKLSQDDITFFLGEPNGTSEPESSGNEDSRENQGRETSGETNGQANGDSGTGI